MKGTQGARGTAFLRLGILSLDLNLTSFFAISKKSDKGRPPRPPLRRRGGGGKQWQK